MVHFFKFIHLVRVQGVGMDNLQCKEDRKGNFVLSPTIVIYVVGVKRCS